MADIGILFLLWECQKKKTADKVFHPNSEPVQNPPNTLPIKKEKNAHPPWIVPN